MRFFIDSCTGKQLADWLRLRGHDVAEAVDRGPDPGDPGILAVASAERRVLITVDKGFGALASKGASHVGIVILPEVPPAIRISLVERLLTEFSEEQLAGQVVSLRRPVFRFARSP